MVSPTSALARVHEARQWAYITGRAGDITEYRAALAAAIEHCRSEGYTTLAEFYANEATRAESAFESA